jgi:plastocyanin
VKFNKRSAGTIIAALALAVVVLFFMGALPLNSPRSITQGSFQPVTNNQPLTNSGMVTTNSNTTLGDGSQGPVAVGGGNLTVSFNQFSPSNIVIPSGQSVTFYAPTGSTEIHNVVFDLTNGAAMSSVEQAFILPSGFSPETLQLAPPDNFGEPIIQNMSDGRQSIVALNKVLFHPSAVSQSGEAIYLQEQELSQQMQQAAQQGLILPPSLSANYTMQGSEVIVSSGLILDLNGFAPLQQGAQQQTEAEGQQQQLEQTPESVENSTPPAYPILSNFTVTFNEPGAYPFFCAFHPGMGGVVNVIDRNTT